MPANYVLVTTADVAPEDEDTLNTWYNEIHVPDFVACPGFISASRYESTGGEPKFLAIYEMESLEALSTPDIQKVWGWGPMAPLLRNFTGRVYKRTLTHNKGD